DKKSGDAAAPEGAEEGSGSSDISKLGAKGDGKTDSTKALNDAWEAACGRLPCWSPQLLRAVHVDNLVITGKGTLDGQGKEVWDNNKCAKKYDCKILPN
ncbi:hypothetical protein ACJX0J_028358, partial [Zea mays]